MGNSDKLNVTDDKWEVSAYERTVPADMTVTIEGGMFFIQCDELRGGMSSLSPHEAVSLALWLIRHT